MKREYAVRFVEPLGAYLLARVVDNLQDAHNQAQRMLSKINVTEAQAHELVPVSEDDGTTVYDQEITVLKHRIAILESLLRQCASWIEHAEDDRPEDRKECATARARLIRGALVHDELLPER
jgi:hypothetical protein